MKKSSAQVLSDESSSVSQSDDPRRKHTRFSSEQVGVVYLENRAENGQKIRRPALVVNESFKGCCVISLIEKNLEKGEKIGVRVSDMKSVLAAEVKWTQILEPGVIKIGLRYLD